MAIILANDGIASSAKAILEELGHVVDIKHYDGAELDKKMQEVDCVIIRSSTKIRKPLIDKALETGKLKLIIRAGVGIDNIDHKYAGSKDIIVRNTPNSSSNAVAELVVGSMFSLSRHIYHTNLTMREGKWNKKQYMGIELNRRTLGLVGFGRIAQQVAKKAKALGMHIIYTDIVGKHYLYPEYKFVTKEELLQQADFISLHIPYIKADGPYLGKEEFKQMKKGSYLIHAARGKVVDEEALLWALDEGNLEKAALDVFCEEPTRNERIYTHEKISLTPHIGASTIEAQERIGNEIISLIKELL